MLSGAYNLSPSGNWPTCSMIVCAASSGNETVTTRSRRSTQLAKAAPPPDAANGSDRLQVRA